jgi:acyl dehydratase
MNPSRIVGTRTVDVTARMTMAYAAALGATEAVYFDDLRLDMVAPPPFCVRLEWPLIADGSFLDGLDLSGDPQAARVHVLQDTTWTRMIRPGDRLTSVTSLVAVHQTSAGAYVLVRVETVCARTNKSVTSTNYGIMLRGLRTASVFGDAPKMGPLEVGGKVSTYERFVEAGLPHVYTECADIWNPIHTERRVAQRAGLPDVILHGTATWALGVLEGVRRYAGGDPNRLTHASAQFKAMVFPGTTIRYDYEDHPPGSTGIDVTWRCTTADGAAAVPHGTLRFHSV